MNESIPFEVLLNPEMVTKRQTEAMWSGWLRVAAPSVGCGSRWKGVGMFVAVGLSLGSGKVPAAGCQLTLKAHC